MTSLDVICQEVKKNGEAKPGKSIRNIAIRFLSIEGVFLSHNAVHKVGRE